MYRKSGDMNLSATPTSHALVHKTKQSCTTQIGLLLGETIRLLP